MKSKITAYILWVLSIFGWFGLHRFYLGKKVSGIIWIFTGGVMGIGGLYDLFSLGEQVNQINRVIILERLAGGLEVADLKIFDSFIESQGNKNSYLCPYCKMGLKYIAPRKMRCPFCKNIIKVRFKQKLFASVLLTKENAAIVDHFKILKRFNISESDFVAMKKNLSAKYKEEILSTDVFWKIFRQVISDIKDLELLKASFRSFALFLKDAEMDYFNVLQRSARMRLLELKNDFKKVRIISFGMSDSCQGCKQLEGKVFTISEALSNMPIPSKFCTYKLGGLIANFCRCSYEGVDD